MSNAERFRQVESELDLLRVRGSGTDPETLSAAGIDQAELLVAATNSDETNLLSALLARQAGVSNTIGRVESRRLRRPEGASLFDGMDDHLVIDPDQEVADSILRLVEYPGAVDIARMADGEVVVIGAEHREPGASAARSDNTRVLPASRIADRPVRKVDEAADTKGHCRVHLPVDLGFGEVRVAFAAVRRPTGVVDDGL